MLKKYLPFWEQVYTQAFSNLSTVSNYPQVPVYRINQWQHLDFNLTVANNYLVHHKGFNPTLIRYLYDRGLLKSGYINHYPVIAFIERGPINKQQEKYLPYIDPQKQSNLQEDIQLSLGRIQSHGQQNEPPLGIDYLPLYATHYSYQTNREKHLLLNSYGKYYRYASNTASGFNIRIGKERSRLILCSSPIEALSYLQLHLNHHNVIQDSVILVDNLENNQFINFLVKHHYQNQELKKITIVPGSGLHGQEMVQNVIAGLKPSQRRKIKIQYPLHNQSWNNLLQQQIFNNQHYLIPHHTLSTKQNQQVINNTFIRTLGQHDANYFGLQLAVLAEDYQHGDFYSGLSQSSIDYLQTTHHLMSYSAQSLVYDYLTYIGKAQSPVSLMQQFDVTYQKQYHHSNPLVIKYHSLNHHSPQQVNNTRLNQILQPNSVAGYSNVGRFSANDKQEPTDNKLKKSKQFKHQSRVKKHGIFRDFN